MTNTVRSGCAAIRCMSDLEDFRKSGHRSRVDPTSALNVAQVGHSRPGWFSARKCDHPRKHQSAFRFELASTGTECALMGADHCFLFYGLARQKLAAGELGEVTAERHQLVEASALDDVP